MPQFRGPARYSFVAFRLTPVFLPYGFQFLGIGSGHGGLLSVFDAIQFQELLTLLWLKPRDSCELGLLALGR